MNVEKNRIAEEFKLIDLLKFVCAFLVIGIHTRPFQEKSELLDKLFYYDISNYAVPFFYACTGYFLIFRYRENLQDKLLSNVQKFLKIYLRWSVIYLPLTLYGCFIEGKFKRRYLIRCLQNYLFVGKNYYSWTLWYLNGLIFALFLIAVLIRKLSIRNMTLLGLIFYIIGIVLSVLNEYISELPAVLTKFIAWYFEVFMTTRNGLFQSFIFLLVGMMVAEKEANGKIVIIYQKTLLFLITYILKVVVSLKGGMVQYISKILDLPIFWFMFEMIIYGCKNLKLKGKFYSKLRKLNSTIYFVHMYFVAFCALILFKDSYYNFKVFLVCSFASTVVALINNKE